MASERKVTTMQLGQGIEYAKVADRLKEFRSDNPHGKTETVSEIAADGSTIFTVYIWKNKDELLGTMKLGITEPEALRATADANGSAKGQVGTKEKDYEKLETVALGRALAMLGYLSSGEIASSEEMEEFHAFKAKQVEEALKDAAGSLESAKTLDELRARFMALSAEQKIELSQLKDKLKAKLDKPTKKTGKPKAEGAKS